MWVSNLVKLGSCPNDFQITLEDRIFSTSKREAFLTLKDHKENFVNNKPTRLINPTKSEIGKISKKILESVRDVVKEKTNIMQWKNTVSVLQWFKTITEKQKYTFIQFDIVNFYPSITEKLLTAALDWATTFAPITEEQRKTIFHVRQNFLFNNSEPWVKKGYFTRYDKVGMVLRATKFGWFRSG